MRKTRAKLKLLALLLSAGLSVTSCSPTHQTITEQAQQHREATGTEVQVANPSQAKRAETQSEQAQRTEQQTSQQTEQQAQGNTKANLLPTDGKHTYEDKGAYAVVDNNVPYFDALDFNGDYFEEYSELDNLGRCGEAYANLCQELMPTEKRGDISSVKPAGWKSVKYDFIEGKYLYNRCHLIGWQLAGENANELNLVTGTRYFNVEGMLPFEDSVAEFIRDTDNHVLYQVTPYYRDNELLPRGVFMEAQCVEEKDALKFHVYVYNMQPGVEIDYLTGDSREAEETAQAPTQAPTHQTAEPTQQQTAHTQIYIVNINTKVFHRTDCGSVKRIKDENKEKLETTSTELQSNGYTACKVCNP